MKPLPKHVYMALPAAEKRKVKAAVVGQGAYKNFVRGKGAYKNFVRGKGAYSRVPRNIRGKGGFFGDAIRTIGGVANGVILPVAQRAGQFVDGLVGMGSYKSAPGVSTLAPPSVPLMHKNARSNTFTYREYLGDVYSSVDFANTVFNLNPGLGDPGNVMPQMAGMFPWLSDTAQKYEQYRIDQMIIEFISTSSDAVVSGATTSSLGQVCIATQYNTNLASFTNLTDALNSQYATTEKPSTNFCHPIECVPREKAQNVQYVRSQPLTGSQDILQYDMGQVNLITQGMPVDGEVVGQLWVSYKVSLFKPILLNEGGPNINFAHYSYNNSKTDVTGTTIFGATDGNMVATSTTNMHLVFSHTANTVTFPNETDSGVYEVTICAKGSAGTVASAFVGVFGSCAAYPILAAGTLAQVGNAQSCTAAYVATTTYVKISGGGANLTWNTFTLPPSVTSVDVIVTQMNDNSTLLASPKKFGNFFRPRRGQATAPWMRGKFLHDRTKAPRRFIEYSDGKDLKEPESDDETDDEEEDELLKLLIERRRHRKPARIAAPVDDKKLESKEDNLPELSESELDLINRLRSAKKTFQEPTQTPREEYVKVDKPSPVRSASTKS